MPNPYEDLFEEEEKGKKPLDSTFESEEFEVEQFSMEGKEPLDEILDRIKEFDQQAVFFSKLLSQTRAIDHKPSSNIHNFLSYFVASNQKELDQESLIGEQKYHQFLSEKFTAIIVPMRHLAKLHLETVKQFNQDIDKDYYSIEKTSRRVKLDKSAAVDGIHLQRKILADATDNLDILKDGLENTESRIKDYVNAGGINNISISEYEMIVRKRQALTSGRDHQFDYSFFDVNLLDKTAISLGIYMKETTSQYLSKLLTAFELN